jgi:hypothetical protein
VSKHLKAPQCDVAVEKVLASGKRLRTGVWKKQFIAKVIVDESNGREGANHSTVSSACQAKYSPIPEVE